MLRETFMKWLLNSSDSPLLLPKFSSNGDEGSEDPNAREGVRSVGVVERLMGQP